MNKRFFLVRFTPVDVLVVVFVSLFVMAVILPSCRRSRMDSYRTICLNNLAQIGKGMQIYTNDNDGKYPRAGGPTSQWSMKIPNWLSSDRNRAFRLDDNGNGGFVTVSSSLYLLVKYAGLLPKVFVCPGDSGVKEFIPINFGVGDRAPAELWDFGPYFSPEVNPSYHCSYAYQMPYSDYALTTSSDPNMAVVADRNPWMSLTAETVKDFSRFHPDGDRESVKTGNAFAHDDEGQNVLFIDGHVNFETTSFCGLNQDNIYTLSDEDDARIGRIPKLFSNKPRNEKDLMLVNDSQIYKETSTIQTRAVNSADLKYTSVVATLDCPMPEHRNIIWCSTFQIAWNKLKDDIIGEPIQVLGAEEMAARLNNAKIVPSDLNEDSYYATAGFNEKGITEIIRKEMAKRFPSESVPDFNELEELPLFMRDKSIISYSFLNIDIEFEQPFYKNNYPFEFLDSYTTRNSVTSFCSDTPEKDSNEERIQEQVDILYHKYSDQDGEAEYAVDLCKTTQPYQVVLALVPRQSTLRLSLDNVQHKISGFKRQRGYRTMRKLRPIDSLIVPDVLYKITHYYPELENKYIGNQPWRGYVIFEAMQVIDFSLSRTGIILKSESRMGGGPVGIFGPRIREEPRYFYFNKPFLIYVKKRGAEHNPFFVMWVDNAELLKKYN